MGRLPQDRVAKAMQVLSQNPKPFTSFCFRCVKPAYGNINDAFSGRGSLTAAGRFHAKGEFLIVYASATLEGAVWEYTNTARNAGINVAELLPTLTLSAHLRLSSVLDLTETAARLALGVTIKELRDGAWNLSGQEALTQRIGRLGYQAGFEAIIAPSGSGHPNINLLLQNKSPSSVVEIVNENELPKKDLSFQ